ncbi:hypothetical protein [Caldisericum exile]|uniref:Uncharacterized protein n=1 Tax=Caldisericum exile (strain DSM 21853 / NBRC 104410 / AZM16c01) TaxID=511051 RepID=A0A7U6GFS8_CALEA|nr:hypothetical protein [Caldisericum exile]BAL81522.1 hypothetical protein CSE_13960 [Caldisericum exile AZM16c01]
MRYLLINDIRNKNCIKYNDVLSGSIKIENKKVVVGGGGTCWL